MNAHKTGWFTEIGAPKGSNVALSILSSKTLHEEQSEYQHIIVFERLVSEFIQAKAINLVNCTYELTPKYILLTPI
jgi:spermidine synthase